MNRTIVLRLSSVFAALIAGCLIANCGALEPSDADRHEDFEPTAGEPNDESGVLDGAQPDEAFYMMGASMNIAWPFGPNEHPDAWSGDEGSRTSGLSGSFCNGTRSSTHAGADYYARDLSLRNGDDYGKPIYAGLTGKVIRAADVGDGYGLTVVIYDASRRVAVRYSHLSSVGVSRGQWVNIRQFIGRVGCSGKCTGAHLHLTGYENINDNNGNPIIPFLCDSDYFVIALYFTS